MNDLALKHLLFDRIDKFVNDTADRQLLEDFFYHPELAMEMTEAAFAVLQCARQNQQYYKQENS